MNLVYAALINVFLSVAFYLLEKLTFFGKWPRAVRQIIIGILFGLCACFSTLFGTDMGGSVINARDASPLCAGLLFGGPSGLIAGFVGAVHRLLWRAPFGTAGWFSAMFAVDAAGGFSRWACVIGTMGAGVFGAYMRKFVLDNKRPKAFYGAFIALTTETFHLLLVFVFRLNFLSRVFALIQTVSIPMLAANILTTFVSVLIIQLLDNKKNTKVKGKKTIAEKFQGWLLISVILSFCVTSLGMLGVQYKLCVKQNEALLTQNLADNVARIERHGVDEAIEFKHFWHVGTEGGVLLIDENSIVQYSDIEGVLGEKVDLSASESRHLYKTAENFFSAEIPLGGQITPIYGMYATVDNGDLLVTFIPSEEASLYQNVTFVLTIFFEILVFSGLFVHVFYIVNRLVVKNMDQVNASLAEITGGNLAARVNVRATEEFDILSDDINETVEALERSISEAAARIDEELEFAKNVQHSALPSIFPPFPSRTDFDIYATMDAAKEVGGDFYDFYFVGRDKLAFLIADVSGKGIAAAMFMMKAKTIIKDLAENELDVDAILTEANERLCTGNDAQLFVTVWMGIIDLETGIISFTSAGHNPPVVCRNDGSIDFYRCKNAFVLGGMEGIKYRKYELQLNKGDKIFLYTDGVTEATDADSQLYGEARLLTTLRGLTDVDTQTVCDRVRDDINMFVGDAPQFDDITMLAFHYKGMRKMKELTVEATVENIPKVTDFVNAELEAIDCPMKAQMQIDIAIDELFGNIAHYAYNPETGKATVAVEVLEDPMQVVVTFVDKGVPYDPLAKDDPDITLSADEREIGGLGIFMVKKTMDEISYEYKNGQNILTIKKQI